MRELDALVIGEALVDVTYDRDGVAEHVGGSPANVALGLGRRGRTVALLTQLAADARGARIREHLARSHVEVRGALVARTSTATATVGADGQASYEFDIRWQRMTADIPMQPRLVHTGSIAVFVQPGADSVFDIIASQTEDVVVTLDPNIRPALVGDARTARRRFEELGRFADIVKLSDEDAAFLYPEEPLEAVLDRVLGWGVRIAAVTRGDKGATLASAKGSVSIPAAPVQVVDTIGAGDTFMVGLIDGYLDSDATDGSALHALGSAAAALAAQTVSRAGADLPWRSVQS